MFLCLNTEKYNPYRKPKTTKLKKNVSIPGLIEPVHERYWLVQATIHVTLIFWNICWCGKSSWINVSRLIWLHLCYCFCCFASSWCKNWRSCYCVLYIPRPQSIKSSLQYTPNNFVICLLRFKPATYILSKRQLKYSFCLIFFTKI